MTIRRNHDKFKFTKVEIDDICKGKYSDIYFNKTAQVLRVSGTEPIVHMQVFGRKDAILCGIDETIVLLRECLGDHFTDFRIEALHDGCKIAPWETVMTIHGPYTYFAMFETIYLGILARRTRIATNVSKVTAAAKGKPVLFFPARFDTFRDQAGDGYAAYVGGATGMSTKAQCEYIPGMVPSGTMPHALIAANGGDTVKAALMYDNYIGDDQENRIVLVDFDNDCIRTSCRVAEAYAVQARGSSYRLVSVEKYIGSGRGKLYGVRFDTSNMLVDASVDPYHEKSFGVCSELVWKARKVFDDNKWKDLKIVVSGGFTAEKVELFEKLKVPVDIYAVGSSLLSGSYDFTADIVMCNGKHAAKEGRIYSPNERLEPVL
jgi:nicotinate phosphoribosyltransferase